MLTDLMGDEMLPADWRQKLAEPHADLHSRRSPETVARLERQMGLR
jgi:hypothetical protein